MKKKWITIFIMSAAITALIITLFVMPGQLARPDKVRSSGSPKASVEMKKARWEYFHRMLLDPATGEIPPNIRERELAYARTLPVKGRGLSKTAAVSYTWNEAGPDDVGGRTRALGIDVRNSNIIIAGAVSGGIWKSTDNGSSWAMKSTLSQHLSVTSLAQDPRSGHQDTWYYCAGEYNGNSASDRGYRAYYRAAGLYKSTDNGETWQQIQDSGSYTTWDSRYDYTVRITVSPINGYVFFADNAGGIYRSMDGGSNFSRVLGTWGDHRYADVVAASNGTLVAAISEEGGSAHTQSPGIYKSTDHGSNWTDITPVTFPTQNERTVLAIAPSNTDIVYALTHEGGENLELYKITISYGGYDLLTANLPNFGGNHGKVNTQGNYNMVIAVKPDDENFVLIGGTSLFRSTDGFSTPLTTQKTDWIGGYSYHSSEFFYPDQHPDQHVIAFDPSDPDKVWFGHDGGLTYTTDITTTSYGTFFPWINKNNGYNVTQCYTVAIPEAAGDNRIIIGTQDNGSPSFRSDGTAPPTASVDVSSGDGAYAHFGSNVFYTSSQNGRVLRAGYDGSGNPISAFTGSTQWSYVYPSAASSQKFINPYIVDPNNEEIMYYPAGRYMWRNLALSTIPNYQNSGTTVGWSSLASLSAPAGYEITALAVSRSPANVLYYGASASKSTANPLLIYRVENAHQTSVSRTDISIPGLTSDGSYSYYIHCIAINPIDANEVMAIFSNFNVVGIYHSTDGGSNWTAVEGNLEGNVSNPGPSIRSALIIPKDGATVYMVGTSTGIYSTQTLNGSSTVWEQEGANEIGNVVVEYLAMRPSDYRVVAGTHGRGAFVGEIDPNVYVDDDPINPVQFHLAQNYPNPFNPVTEIAYTLPDVRHVTLRIYDSRGRKIATLVNEKQDAGEHSVQFDAGRLASGVYVCRLESGGEMQARKMMLVK